MTYFDYRLKFPVVGLPTALSALAALKASGVMVGEDVPQNMLGSPRDAAGSVTASSPLWRGEPGRASTSFTDPGTGLTVTLPACGDPAYFYIHIRTAVSPASIGLDPATYGLIACTPEETASVLGVWA